MNVPQNTTDAKLSSAPSYDFRASVDTTRFTKAVYIVLSTNVTGNVYNEITEGNIAIRVGGQFYPFRTKTALSGYTGYDVIYCY